MYEDKLVRIKNINKVSKHIGKDVANTLGIPLNELSIYIKPKEIKSLLKQYAVRKDEDYMLNTVILQKIYREVNNWVLGIQLCKMSAEGQLETRWDDEQNCMLFESLKIEGDDEDGEEIL